MEDAPLAPFHINTTLIFISKKNKVSLKRKYSSEAYDFFEIEPKEMNKNILCSSVLSIIILFLSQYKRKFIDSTMSYKSMYNFIRTLIT